MALAVRSRIATITGTFIKPGWSGNNRLYSTEAISRGITSAQESLKAGASIPVTMLTGHPEDKTSGGQVSENVLTTVGAVREMWQDPDGSGRFRADIPDTTAGRDLLGLVAPDPPYIRTVSWRGEWEGDVRRVSEAGRTGVTAPGVRFFGIDYTRRPGIDGAQIDSVAISESEQARGVIAETHDAGAIVVEALQEPEITEAAGVYEDRQRMVRDALQKRYSDSDWVSLISTTDDDVAYEVTDGSSAGTYLVAYTLDDRGVVTLGEPRKAAVEQIVIPQESLPALGIAESLIFVDPDNDGDIDYFLCPECGSVRPAPPELDADPGEQT
jgi:hypothetical protein